MNDGWAKRVKKRLERAGYKVRLVDPSLAMERKKTERLQDAELLATGRATPDQIQTKNSLFRGRQKQFRILDYGGFAERG